MVVYFEWQGNNIIDGISSLVLVKVCEKCQIEKGFNIDNFHLHLHLRHHITRLLSANLRIKCATVIWALPLIYFNKCVRDMDSSGILIDAAQFNSEYIVRSVSNFNSLTPMLVLIDPLLCGERFVLGIVRLTIFHIRKISKSLINKE
jgi:hypothetical protein